MTKLVQAGLLATLCYIGFAFFKIDIPVGTGKSAFHLGNVFCVLAALLLGGFWGGLLIPLPMPLFHLRRWLRQACFPFLLWCFSARSACCRSLWRRHKNRDRKYDSSFCRLPAYHRGNRQTKDSGRHCQKRFDKTGAGRAACHALLHKMAPARRTRIPVISRNGFFLFIWMCPFLLRIYWN